MKKIAGIIGFTALAFVMFSPVMAESGTPARENYASLNASVERGAVPVDKELAKKHDDFEGFAKWKVRQFNSNHRFSRSRMQVTKQADGSYRARYHEIDNNSLSFKVRRSQSKSTPFVGVLSYREQVYESFARTPELFQDAPFDVVEIIPNRHIFSYLITAKVYVVRLEICCFNYSGKFYILNNFFYYLFFRFNNVSYPYFI